MDVTVQIGFIGLGHMGNGMARNLTEAGHALTVFNRTRSQAEPFRALGVRVGQRTFRAGSDASAANVINLACQRNEVCIS